MNNSDPLKDVLLRSTELSKAGRENEAFALLDKAIAEAKNDNRLMWIRILTRHAAVISDSFGDLQRVRHYHEQLLAFDPDDPGSLYGLANALRRQGAIELAKQYATKCFLSIRFSEHELDKAVLEMLLDAWPDLKDLQGD